MDFPGRYDDHFMPDQLHNINLSLMVNGLVENFGGTAGNIAYALSLLAEKPRILAASGQDSQKYLSGWNGAAWKPETSGSSRRSSQLPLTSRPI